MDNNFDPAAQELRVGSFCLLINYPRNKINMPRSAKGSRRERELLEFLTHEGYVVHRVAGSGVKEEAICDLVAVRDGLVQFIECKSRIKVYYPKQHTNQLKELINAARSCGAKPILAVKLNYKDWKFFDIEKGIPEKVV